jgi:hypothetical protein
MEIEMKKVILFSIIIPILHIFPQVREIESRSYFTQGDVEFNFSTNLGVGFSSSNIFQTIQNFYPYDSSYYEYSSQQSDREFNLLFTASFGYCIVDGLTIEPELDINLVTDNETSISLIGNLTYNFNIPRKNTYPFIKLGYGLSNYYSDSHYGYSNESGGSSLDTRVINAGAGLKFLYSSGMALKLEINFKNYNYSTTSSYTDQYYLNAIQLDGDMNVISLSIGFSILL